MAINNKIQNLIRTFVKNISTDAEQSANTSTVYGTVVSGDGTKQVLLDGGTDPTACIFNVEADVGDRVVCSVQNHSWSVDSNVTKPASSPTTVKGRSDVESIIDEKVISLSGIDVYYQVDEPTAPSEGFKDGDTWYQLDANGYAIGLYVWKTNQWVSTQFDGGSIIRANSITSNEIASNTITGNKIASNTITTTNLSVSTLSAISSNIGTITAGTIKGTTITGNTISGGTISGTSITGGTISGTSITGGTIVMNATLLKIQMNTNGLQFYDYDGNKLGDLNGVATGTGANTGIYLTGTRIHLNGKIHTHDDLYVGSDYDDNAIVEANGYFRSTRPDIGFTHTHRTSGTQVSFGVGSGGTNRGIYDNTESEWMIYRGPYNKVTFISGGIRTSGNVIPHTDGEYNLGGSSNRWNVVCTNALWLFRATSYHFAFAGTPTANRTITFQNASGTVAFTSSDIRLKENIEDSDVCALDVINKMQIRKFDWKDIDDAGYNKGTHQNIGFIADELEKLDPRFIVDGSGGFNDDDSINPKCIDTFYLAVHLAKGIQELNDEVQKLKKALQEV